MLKKVEYGKPRYYQDETKDDFLNTKTNLDITIDSNYKYLNRNPIYNFFSSFVYYIIALPILSVYGRVFKGLRIKNKKNLRKAKKTGYVLYINHSNMMDPFLGHVFLSRLKRAYVIASKDAVSIFFVKTLVKALGTLPVPDTTGGLKNLHSTISDLLAKKRVIVVYPEAHLWPYYTGIRPFPATSFRFAANNNVPAIPVAVTYTEPKAPFKSRKKPKPIVYIGEPVYPDPELGSKANAEMLRDKCYEYIKTTINEKSTCALYEYKQKDPNIE